MKDACGRLLELVNGAVMCAVVDLDTGILLAMESGPRNADDLCQVVIDAAMKLVRGAVVGNLVSALAGQDSEDVVQATYLQEALLTTPSHSIICRTVANGQLLTLLVTSREVSAGMGWAQLNALMPEFEAAAF